MKHVFYLLLVILCGCATPVSPGMSVAQSLKQYRDGIEETQDQPERWPDRQELALWLKHQYRYAAGSSKEFEQLVDLDTRRRELMITLNDSRLRPERAAEIKEELARINKNMAALIASVKGQLMVAESRAQEQPQRIEAIAAIGLLTLGLEAFSSGSGSSYPIPSSTRVNDRYTVTDQGSFAMVQAPEGRSYRCNPISVSDIFATIKCE